MPSIASLIVPPTEDEVMEMQLGVLQEAGFPVSSWQAGSVPRVLLQAFAKVQVEAWKTIAAVAAAASLEDASGDWLKLHTSERFAEEPTSSEVTKGTILLEDVGGAGPWAITVGQLWVTTASGLKYNNTEAGTLDALGTLELEFVAEGPGEAYNVPNGTITILATPLPGVEVSNPDPGSGTWITQTGRDEESEESLKTKSRLKWGSLGPGSPADLYDYWARKTSADVTRTKIDDGNPDGPGTVRVYLASNSGPSSGDVVTEVDDVLQVKRTQGVTVTTLPAVTQPLNVTATIYVATASLSVAQGEAAANMAALFGELEIGATVYKSEITRQLQSCTGVRNVTLVTPASDFSQDPSDVCVPTLNLTWVSI